MRTLYGSLSTAFTKGIGSSASMIIGGRLAAAAALIAVGLIRKKK